MNKKRIYVDVGTPSPDKYSNGGRCIRIENRESVYVEGSLTSTIKTLQGLKSRYSKEYANLTLVGRRDCGCRYDCTCSDTLYLHGEREESDLEYEFRTAQEAQQKADREDRERQEYEKLKAKFGDK